MDSTFLMDTVETEKRTYRGIFDHQTARHVFFIDTTMVDDPDLVKAVVIWRLFFPHLRFSVYRDKFLGGKYFGDVKCIPRRQIKSISFVPIAEVERTTRAFTIPPKTP